MKIWISGTVELNIIPQNDGLVDTYALQPQKVCSGYVWLVLLTKNTLNLAIFDLNWAILVILFIYIELNGHMIPPNDIQKTDLVQPQIFWVMLC